MKVSNKPAIKIKKTMEIDSEKLRKVRIIFSAKTDTQAIDMALELAVANAEIEKTMRESYAMLSSFEVK